MIGLVILLLDRIDALEAVERCLEDLEISDPSSTSTMLTDRSLVGSVSFLDLSAPVLGVELVSFLS